MKADAVIFSMADKGDKRCKQLIRRYGISRPAVGAPSPPPSACPSPTGTLSDKLKQLFLGKEVLDEKER